MPEMPALPDADWLGGAYAQAWRATTVRGWPKENAARYTAPLFTADQMQAYAAAAVAAEREACAALCDTVAYTHQNTPMLGPELNALKCAAAIRERK